jgi:hypothetical protein
MEPEVPETLRPLDETCQPEPRALQLLYGIVILLATTSGLETE